MDETSMPDQTTETAFTDKGLARDLPKLSVIGLGKLGAPMAAVFACAGYRVTGTDHTADLVDMVRAGTAPFSETDLQSQFSQAGDRLRAVYTTAEAVAESDISFVIVPTPSGPDGLFSNHFLLDAVSAIGAAAAKKDTYHLVVITSTVVPGTTGTDVLAALEASSGKCVGGDIGLCYSPEFIALGSVVRDMKNPDLVLIGESDPKAGDMLEAVYRRTCESNPVSRRMNFVNAELAKIAINTFVTTKISYANMLSGICDALPGADIDAISAALGADSRIGPKYLKGGAAFGGPCFPRDNKALSAFAAHLGIKAHIAEATDALNMDQTDRLVRLLEANHEGPANICVCGLAYKTDTNVTEKSAGLSVLLSLRARGHTVWAHDPQVQQRDITSDLTSDLTLHSDLETALKGADALLLMTPWPEYQDVPQKIVARKNPLTIIDPWRLFNADNFEDGVTYIAVGRP